MGIPGVFRQGTAALLVLALLGVRAPLSRASDSEPLSELPEESLPSLECKDALLSEQQIGDEVARTLTETRSSERNLYRKAVMWLYAKKIRRAAELACLDKESCTLEDVTEAISTASRKIFLNHRKGAVFFTLGTVTLSIIWATSVFSKQFATVLGTGATVFLVQEVLYYTYPLRMPIDRRLLGMLEQMVYFFFEGKKKHASSTHPDLENMVSQVETAYTGTALRARVALRDAITDTERAIQILLSYYQIYLLAQRGSSAAPDASGAFPQADLAFIELNASRFAEIFAGILFRVRKLHGGMTPENALFRDQLQVSLRPLQPLFVSVQEQVMRELRQRERADFLSNHPSSAEKFERAFKERLLPQYYAPLVWGLFRVKLGESP